MKTTLILLSLLLGLLLVGCEERLRYPCQNPHNWNDQRCQKPFCSANGTCPEDLSHYLKEQERQKVESKSKKEICK
jgi:hypothetical protein